MFDFYSSLARHGQRFNDSLESQIEAARRAFPPRGLPDHCICVSHRRRVALNRIMEKRHLRAGRPPETQVIPKTDQKCDVEPQKMTIWPGVVLVASMRECHNGAYNSQMLRVKSLGEKIEFECLESGRGYQLSPEFVQKWLRPSWALVYHQLQGRTMERALELHDLTHPRLTTTHLLVALSRARSASQVWLAA